MTDGNGPIDVASAATYQGLVLESGASDYREALEKLIAAIPRGRLSARATLARFVIIVAALLSAGGYFAQKSFRPGDARRRVLAAAAPRAGDRQPCGKSGDPCNGGGRR